VSGRLVLAATPIGDPSDASSRLTQVLASADVLAAEDTRRLRRLLRALDVEPRGRVLSYHEHNEGRRTAELVEAMRSGGTVVVVTDAGMPSVSDPGYRLVVAAVEAQLDVTAVPGPSALTMALALSALPVDRFCFEGFLPRKSGQRRERLRTLADEPRTLVFFEAPHRLAEVLGDLAELWEPTRRAAVCRELTKTYEEVRRGTVDELAAWALGGVRGEVTLVVAGCEAPTRERDADELASLVAEAMSGGLSRRDAVDVVAVRTGLPRRQVYDAAHR
jgi:16S rRNA (cytidine1402-2'-O)-methyltransferase